MTVDGLRLYDLNGQHVVIWGFGVEGRAAVSLLKRHATPRSISVIIDGDLPSGSADTDGIDMFRATDPRAVACLSIADVIVKSPGVSPYVGALASAQHKAIVTGGTALWFAETQGAHTIGVTGSKGKSTTTSLIAHLLTAVGRDVVLAGNVGWALLDVLDEKLSTARSGLTAADEIVSDAAVTHAPVTYALELSSFQTSEVKHSPEVGVLTALFPEHLDWHGSVDRYYRDKINLFAHRRGMLVAANMDNPTVADRSTRMGSVGVMGYGAVGLHVSGTNLCDVDGFPLFDITNSQLPGRHNAINLCGALTALRAYGIDLHTFRQELQNGITNFQPLEHRLQPVGEVSGRLVIDDSLSTAPQAAVAALAAFADRPVGIVIGGHDRGLDYQPLADALAKRSTPTWVCGVPMSGERIVPLIERTLRAVGNTAVTVRAFDDFDDAVHHAAAMVPAGGVILLSPAAPSFGRFSNYRDRGLHFRALLGLG